MSTFLRHVIDELAAVLRKGGLWWGLGLSVVLGVGSLALATAVVVAWPPDHFKRDRTRLPDMRHPVIIGLGIVGKNLAGIVLFVLGLVMALPGIPGQGILTMIIAVTLLDLPGKRQLERPLIRRPAILRRLNALRARFHRPPLELE